MTADNLKQVAHMDGLFTWPSDEPHLIGGRCKSCGAHFFPRFLVTHKAGCNERAVEDILLSRKGKVATYCVQHYPAAKPFINPEPFVPYAIAWVALPEGISVAGIVTGCRPEDVTMHMDVELVVEGLGIDEGGNEAMTWKWRPA